MIVLDTNVVSELMRPSPSSAVLAWMSGQTPEDLFTTTITMAEVLFGIELLPKGKRRDQLLDEAEATFAEDFARRVLPFDEQAASMFALIAATRRMHGRPIYASDAQIAAIASTHRATLATCNAADFEGCGVGLVNPWRE